MASDGSPSRCAPPLASQAAFFALYELTNRGSSWLGPLILTTSIATTGTYTYAFAYILVACIGSAIGLCFIDMKKAHKAAIDRANLWSTVRDLNPAMMLKHDKSSAVLKGTELKPTSRAAMDTELGTIV